MIEITQDSLTIYNENREEILHWVVDEIKDDPEVAFVMANAVKIYYEEGIAALLEYIKN